MNPAEWLLPIAAFTLGAGIFYLSPLMLSLLFAGLVLIAAWEWANLSGLSSLLAKGLFTLSCAALIVAAMMSMGFWTTLAGKFSSVSSTINGL